ncbi:MAG: hypothetical protein K8R90_07675 [Candidatus Cloacimonetes bacterium]|nr:hypothetical protein [Candidatus Cloacimonadota bacterium]
MSTDIILVGTLHNRHADNTLYPAEQITKILAGIAPKAILMDLPVDLAGTDGWLPSVVLERDVRPEFGAVLDAAHQLGVGVVPIDMADFANRFDEVNRHKDDANEKLQTWRTHLEQRESESPFLKVMSMAYELGGIQRFFVRHSGAFTLNGEGFDRIVRMRHNIWHDLFPDILKDNPNYAGLVQFWNAYHQFWYDRNRAMIDHIIQVAEAFKGKRLAVVVGVEHRYLLHELMPRRDDIVLREFWEIDG